ncbi:carboxymuconolactone decarboxylase family protein [Sphingomonas sp. G124]|uniref:Carboxymuconolactone decarboxylase family protein n=1 Tax=Sphingomonas cremea TaxID=2904799 RepID=A0A9X1QKK7_9SPHN|nr:carboxymuconolactone decarboxylase family protein [Sphingomonas cremea]MCF2515428.1 carboxymuconolactone decarboxylase family protein [Sphingomonas cremea]
MSERYMRGIEIAEQLAAEKLEEFTTSRVAELAPDFARMAIEFPLGDLYARNGLDLRSREIAAISSLATLGNADPQLRIHIQAATQVGLTKAEIIEILMQTAIYAGFPSALNALASCHDLLTEERPCQAARRVAGQG